MKQFLSIVALTCACSVSAQESRRCTVGVYGRAEAVPKNDGFLRVLVPTGGDVSARVTCGLSLTHAISERWQWRFEPGFAYARYSAYQAVRDYSRGFEDRSAALQGRIYDKNYLFCLQLPLTATYYIVEQKLMISSGLETSIAALNYRKAAYQSADGHIDKIYAKNWLPALYSFNIPLSVAYQFRLSRRLISIEPGLNLCLTRPLSGGQHDNRYSLKLAYYF